MAKLSFTIDELTKSIVNRLSGDSFKTSIIKLKSDDLKFVKKGWKFDWSREFQNTSVYKLVIDHSPEVIQGLVSF